MTIHEAVQLITQSTVLARNGEVLVLDMGEPVKIRDLAQDLIRLRSIPRHKEVRIRFTGLRQGEKVTETLWTKDESVRPTIHEKINVAFNETEPELELDSILDRLWWAAHWGSRDEMIKIIREAIPEFNPSDGSESRMEEMTAPLSNNVEEPTYAQPLVNMGYVEPN